MKALEKTAVYHGIRKILESTRVKGLVGDFVTSLQERITNFLDNMKLRGELDTAVDTSCKVLPSQELAEQLSIQTDREEWEQLYIRADDLEDESNKPGTYLCSTCDYESRYEEQELPPEGAPVVCPHCGDKMHRTKEVDYTDSFDVTDVLDYEIQFKDPELNEIMNELRQTTEGELERIERAVGESLRDRYKEHVLREIVSDRYKRSFTLPQMWEHILELIQHPPHPDTMFRLKGWVLAMAKAYGAISDFGIDVEEYAGGLSVEFRVSKPTSMELKDTPEQHEIASADASFVMAFHMFEMMLMACRKAGKLKDEHVAALMYCMQVVKDEFPELPTRTAKASRKGLDLLYEMRHIMVDAERKLEDELGIGDA